MFIVYMAKCIAQTKIQKQKIENRTTKRPNTFVRSFNCIVYLTWTMNSESVFQWLLLIFIKRNRTFQGINCLMMKRSKKKSNMKCGKSTKWTICVNGISSILCSKYSVLVSIQFGACIDLIYVIEFIRVPTYSVSVSGTFFFSKNQQNNAQNKK